MNLAALCLAWVSFVVVPLDDRPVTRQLPQMLGAIAGVRIELPPRALTGTYLTPGDPDAILRWLRSDAAPQDARAYVVSNDMIAYGGLIASRVPGTPAFLAYSRLRDLAAVRSAHAGASFATFGTVMRLAPTGVPALGEAASFFAAGAAWPLVDRYANLPDPPRTETERALAADLRARLGPVLDDYLATRARDRDVDLFELQLTAEGAFDRVILGQDDAGPVGLHLRDLAALRAYAAEWDRGGRAAIEPGADELGMLLVGAALARQAAYVPHVRVVYSRAGGATVNDPLEFAPIGTTIPDIVRASGAVIDRDGELTLFVRVPETSAADEATFETAIAAVVAAGRLAAVADLSFLRANDLAAQRELPAALIARGIAGRLAAFAAWNTTANTVGTAIPEAIAVAAGKRMGTYDPGAHAQFMLDRYADDFAFHDFTRPALNAALAARGIGDHAYLTPEVAVQAARENRAGLWPRALDLLAQIYPECRDRGLTITLPWDRTFETELDVRLACAATDR
ncbi:MAG: DUF4127 family protein [Candidatus Velthaea sp.]